MSYDWGGKRNHLMRQVRVSYLPAYQSSIRIRLSKWQGDDRDLKILNCMDKDDVVSESSVWLCVRVLFSRHQSQKCTLTTCHTEIHDTL
jgi:hypothetical protein